MASNTSRYARRVVAKWGSMATGPLVLVALLVLAALHLPMDSRVARTRDHLRSLELNSSDRHANAGGYYESIMNGDGGPDELTLALLGQPADWVKFDESGVAAELPGDFLLFELKPNVDRMLYGARFTTNARGLRDRENDPLLDQSKDLVRIALLGSSIDMGWGVETDKTYENRLEDWLNREAKRHGSSRRFVIENYAVAAYSPAQRWETYRRKVRERRPDLVLYSITRLDERLQEIHLTNILQGNFDPQFEPFSTALKRAGLDGDRLSRRPDGTLKDKRSVKLRLSEHLRPAITSAMSVMAGEIHDDGSDLIWLMIPRASLADRPHERGTDVSHYHELAESLGIPLLDVMDAFDRDDLLGLAIAPRDDHPNAHGHKQIYRRLVDLIQADPTIRRRFLGQSSTSVAVTIPINDHK